MVKNILRFDVISFASWKLQIGHEAYNFQPTEKQSQQGFIKHLLLLGKLVFYNSVDVEDKYIFVHVEQASLLDRCGCLASCWGHCWVRICQACVLKSQFFVDLELDLRFFIDNSAHSATKYACHNDVSWCLQLDFWQKDPWQAHVDPLAMQKLFVSAHIVNSVRLIENTSDWVERQLQHWFDAWRVSVLAHAELELKAIHKDSSKHTVAVKTFFDVARLIFFENSALSWWNKNWHLEFWLDFRRTFKVLPACF